MQLPMDWILLILKLVIPLVHFQTSLTTNLSATEQHHECPSPHVACYYGQRRMRVMSSNLMNKDGIYLLDKKCTLTRPTRTCTVA
jgi:hypothetical protein